jgi:hypothetical protein
MHLVQTLSLCLSSIGTRRLKAAKQECDKELQRVTNTITSFFEEKLHEGELELELRD